MAKSNGIVIYDGSSLIDGKPIICILTGIVRTKNPKTGNMLQTWIFCKNNHPWECFISGEDYSVCGDCKHRKWGTCYVTVSQGPSQVWNAFHRGRYPTWNESYIDLIKGRKIRIGSYGEPAAIPYDVWKNIIKYTGGYTGYTHQWRKCDQRLRNICMASVDSSNEAQEAQNRGWKTFRISKPSERLSKNEFHCPAAIESGHKTTCEKCGACGGLKSKRKKNPVIFVHGRKWKMAIFLKIQDLREKKKKYTHLIPKALQKKK